MKRRAILFVFLSMVCANISLAAEPTTQLQAGIKVLRNLQYVASGNPAQVLDLYLPEEVTDKRLPVIMYFHGGAWKGGSQASCPAISYVKSGYAVVSVQYRFSQNALFPAQIQDCQAAVRWLRANRDKYGLDKDHVGAWGGSAGGHLVALMGTAGGKKVFPIIGGNEGQPDVVQAVCDYYGPSDFMTIEKQALANDATVHNGFHFRKNDPFSNLIGGIVGEDREKSEAVSPVHYVSSDCPPFLIVHGILDPAVPIAQSQELADKLKEAGDSVTFQRVPGAKHGGFTSPKIRQLVKAFFDKYLMGIDVNVQALPEDAVKNEPPATTQPKST